MEESATRIECSLASLLGAPVSVILTDNRSSMMHARATGRGFSVRLHRMFNEADDTVVAALARYIANGHKASGRLVDAFIESRLDRVSRDQPIRNAGAVYDLGPMFARLNEDHLSGACRARVTWGPRRRRRPRRKSVQLGCYVEADCLIRMNPVLDSDRVPEYFVGGVLYHEMLHEVLGVERDRAGRRHAHTPLFRAMESLYPDYERCRAWERQHLSLLLRGSI